MILACTVSKIFRPTAPKIFSVGSVLLSNAARQMKRSTTPFTGPSGTVRRPRASAMSNVAVRSTIGRSASSYMGIRNSDPSGIYHAVHKTTPRSSYLWTCSRCSAAKRFCIIVSTSFVLAVSLNQGSRLTAQEQYRSHMSDSPSL